MVHSVELVFDPDTEAAIRHIWTSCATPAYRVRRLPVAPM